MIIETNKIKVSHLKLARYFVTQLNIIANPSFEATKGVVQKEQDLNVSGEMTLDEDPAVFQVRLNIKLQPSAESNLPYAIVIEIVGILKSTLTGAKEDIERVVFVNGSSMIYGTAREIIRASTSVGPYSQIILPTVLFAPPEKAKTETDIITPTPSPSSNI